MGNLTGKQNKWVFGNKTTYLFPRRLSTEERAAMLRLQVRVGAEAASGRSPSVIVMLGVTVASVNPPSDPSDKAR